MMCTLRNVNGQANQSNGSFRVFLQTINDAILMQLYICKFLIEVFESSSSADRSEYVVAKLEQNV